MKRNTSRALIETVVKRTIHDIKINPKRTIRNAVDMAANFSSGRFQREFFTAAQTMLKNKNSPYYDLISNAVCHIDSDRLLRLGMNIGYNSCTAGADIIRKLEESEHFNVPWSIWAEIDGNTLNKTKDRYNSIISQGENMGIHTWLLFVNKLTSSLVTIIQYHPESAFAVFCEPSDITESFLNDISEYKNILLVFRYGNDDIFNTCLKVWNMGFPYSVYYSYNKENTDKIHSGELFIQSARLNSIFTMVVPDKECTGDLAEQTYRHIKLVRNEHTFKTIPLDICMDIKLIDGIISQDATLAGFNKSGQLCSATDEKPYVGLNLFNCELRDMLKKAFPKPCLCEACL